MSLHDAILPDLVEHVKSYHPDCSIVLIGSVARGRQRAESDIDLNIFFAAEDDVQASPYVDADNRWQLSMKPKFRGVRIDVAWETYDGLGQRLAGDGALRCWPFSNGKILHDPAGTVAEYLEVARRWFLTHPEDAQRIQSEYTEAKRQQLQQRRDLPPS